MSLLESSPGHKLPILGTALWGWGVDRGTAFEMLDRFTDLGGSAVDTATNYPINKVAADKGLALDWVADWIRQSGSADIAAIVKVGSTDNLGGDTTDLTSANIRESAGQLRDRLGESLAALSVHWDNRGDSPADHEAIRDTVDELRWQSARGLEVGFSGVRHPELYLNFAPELADRWLIQVRENVQSRAARESYAALFPEARYLAYGINMGGVGHRPPGADSSLKLRSLTYPEQQVADLIARLAAMPESTTRPSDLAELAILDAFCNSALSGVILGPRTPVQLVQSLEYWNRLVEAN